MRGILSRRPCPSATRLIVGGQLLLLVQTVLLLKSRPQPGPTLTAIVITLTLTALFALIAAIAGEPSRSGRATGGRHGHER